MITPSLESSREKLGSLWNETKCTDLIKGQHVIEIAANASVALGCETLVKHNISSAPVFNSENNTYVGMMDYRDIVDYVLVVFQKKRLQPIAEDDSIGILDIVHKATAGKPISAEAVADLSRKNPFYSVLVESPLSAAVGILAEATGIHRVNVIDEASGRVCGVLSQTDIVRYIWTKRDQFSHILDKTLEELGLGQGPVVSASADSTVLDALERMSEYGVSSIAIVDGAGTLAGNISMADIRFIFQNSRFNRLWMPCFSFVSMALSQKGLENDGKDRFPVFDVTLKSTLLHVIRKTLATRVHRMWVVDDNERLIGVVSLTDIIRLFVPKNDS